MQNLLTLFSCMKGVVNFNVLNVVDQSRVGKDRLVFVDSVDGVFECKLRRAIALFFTE